jgi:hypothetical protein
MEAPRRPEPSLVGTGSRRRAQPRDGADYLPDQICMQGTAGALPSGAASSARGLAQEPAGISAKYNNEVN